VGLVLVCEKRVGKMEMEMLEMERAAEMMFSMGVRGR